MGSWVIFKSLMTCGDQNIWVSNRYHKLFERRGLSYSPSLPNTLELLSKCLLHGKRNWPLNYRKGFTKVLPNLIPFFFLFLQNSSVNNILLWTLKIFSENSWRILVEIMRITSYFYLGELGKKSPGLNKEKKRDF